MVEREMIEEMFANIRAKGGWNLDGPLLWGYFFTDGAKQKLEAAAEALVKDGYIRRYLVVGTRRTQRPGLLVVTRRARRATHGR